MNRKHLKILVFSVLLFIPHSVFAFDYNTCANVCNKQPSYKNVPGMPSGVDDTIRNNCCNKCHDDLIEAYGCNKKDGSYAKTACINETNRIVNGSVCAVNNSGGNNGGNGNNGGSSGNNGNNGNNNSGDSIADEYAACKRKCSSHSYESCERSCCNTALNKALAECRKQYSDGNAQRACENSKKETYKCSSDPGNGNNGGNNGNYEKRDLGEDAIFLCEYNVVASADSSKKIPLSITVLKDNKMSADNAGHEISLSCSGSDDNHQCEGNSSTIYETRDAVLNNPRSWNIYLTYENFYKNNFTSCPKLFLYDTGDGSHAELRDNGSHGTSVYPSTDEVRPIINSRSGGGDTPQPNVVQVSKECDRYTFAYDTLRGLTLEVTTILRKYNNGEKEVCLSYNRNNNQNDILNCQKTSGEDNFLFENSNNSFSADTRKLFFNNTDTSFDCPQQLYVVVQSSSEHRYFITGDESDIQNRDDDEYAPSINDSEDPIPEDNIRSVCGVLTQKTKEYIYRILDIIKYAALILVAALSILDFFKAASSEEDDAFTKAAKRFARRIIVVIILFLLPVILKSVLTLIHIDGVDPNNPMCQ